MSDIVLLEFHLFQWERFLKNRLIMSNKSEKHALCLIILYRRDICVPSMGFFFTWRHRICVVLTSFLQLKANVYDSQTNYSTRRALYFRRNVMISCDISRSQFRIYREQRDTGNYSFKNACTFISYIIISTVIKLVSSVSENVIKSESKTISYDTRLYNNNIINVRCSVSTWLWIYVTDRHWGGKTDTVSKTIQYQSPDVINSAIFSITSYSNFEKLFVNKYICFIDSNLLFDLRISYLNV